MIESKKKKEKENTYPLILSVDPIDVIKTQKNEKYRGFKNISLTQNIPYLGRFTCTQHLFALTTIYRIS